MFISCGTDDGDTGNTGNSGQTGDTGNTGNDEDNDECIPNCDGFTCGDDGCGGSCGVCEKENEGCMNQQCGSCSGNFPNSHNGTCWSGLLEEKGDFEMAKEACSSIGGRLPTVDESRSIIINCPATETGGACGITNECPNCYEGKEDDWACNGCSEGGGATTPNTGIYSVFDDEGTFWTSTTFVSKYEENEVNMVTYRQNDLSSANTNASVSWLYQAYDHEFPVRCVSN